MKKCINDKDEPDGVIPQEDIERALKKMIAAGFIVMDEQGGLHPGPVDLDDWWGDRKNHDDLPDADSILKLLRPENFTPNHE